MAHTQVINSDEQLREHEEDEKTIFGFWVYIMTDCVLFASLFATYAVLHNNTNGGITSTQLVNLPYALAETLILLTSSFTCGLAVLALQARRKSHVIGWLAVTFILGLAFLGLEFHEFASLVAAGNSWQRSAYLSSFFTLVATHGLHITSGLIWMSVMFFQVFKKGLTRGVIRRLTLLSLFWHFLDVVWIFIFTIVYCMGAL
jgi:cytochrome o ubiquinol oxidase subunit III